MRLGIQPLLPIGNFLNKRYSIDMDFPDDSNPADGFKHLNEVITAIHMSEYPMCYKDGKPMFSNYQGDDKTETIIKDQISESTQAAIDKINSSKNKEELNEYWLMSKGNLTLSQAYKEKEKEFNNAK